MVWHDGIGAVFPMFSPVKIGPKRQNDTVQVATCGLTESFTANMSMAHHKEAMMKTIFTSKDHDAYSVDKESIRDKYVIVHSLFNQQYSIFKKQHIDTALVGL